jgi:hypothetical protein
MDEPIDPATDTARDEGADVEVEGDWDRQGDLLNP